MSKGNEEGTYLVLTTAFGVKTHAGYETSFDSRRCDWAVEMERVEGLVVPWMVITRLRDVELLRRLRSKELREVPEGSLLDQYRVPPSQCAVSIINGVAKATPLIETPGRPPSDIILRGRG